MDIVRIRCGLANQMFGYAFYCELKKRGREVGLDVQFYTKYKDDPIEDKFRLTNVFKNLDFNPLPDSEYLKREAEWLKLKEQPEKMDYLAKHPEEVKFWTENVREYGTFNPNVFRAKDAVYVGTWKSEKYFSSVRDEVREMFKFETGEKKLQDLASNFQNENVITIQFRIGQGYRHGVYVTKTGYTACNLCEEGYYERAIAYAQEKIGTDAKVVILSDNLDYVKSTYHFDNVLYIEKDLFDDYQDWYDMYLMSVCRCNIIANSTFGWWGAWLNTRENHLVIAPDHCHTFKGELAEARDIYPDNWIRM